MSTAPPPPHQPAAIRLRGVRQNNLRGFDVEIPLGQLVVVTGVSGSGKSSLAFDVLYAEGQRRYVECLSSYARQFLERMDKPQVDDIQGILPSVALRQGKSIRAARATVATLTELGEYFRLVFSHAAAPNCPRCQAPVQRAQVSAMVDDLLGQGAGRRLAVTFDMPVVSSSSARAALHGLAAAGYHRAFAMGRVVPLTERLQDEQIGCVVHVLQDRLSAQPTERLRLHDSLHQALRRGGGTASVWLEGATPPGLRTFRPIEESSGFIHLRASTSLRCTACGTDIAEPSAQLFSSNSAVGACPQCNGFGRLADIDLGRVIPDVRKSLSQGAIKPWSTESTADEREELAAFCARQAIDMDTPWQDLSDPQRKAILEGEKGGWRSGRFYGVRGWFKWLETKSYKMHVRVLLARYRAYLTCPSCQGQRLRPEALAWRLDGLTLPQWLALPVRAVRDRSNALHLESAEALALDQPLRELRHRVNFLDEVGLEYLSLDRPARTLSGGELQRVQLVAALATGMTQVLYVLDEPSVGLHPRDNDRLLRILERLRAAGNTVVVVEHDPALISAADTLIDLGPGAGDGGGQLLFAGPPSRLASVQESLTADYLLGRRRVIPDAPYAKTVARRADADHWLRILAPRARNLCGQDVAFKHGALNVVCGVSGSGKSTLVDEVLYRTLLRKRGEPTDEPGACAGIEGDRGISDVILCDQELPPATSRANCATYLKVWDAIRTRLADEPLAQARGFSSATFSFNREGGRCSVCEGLGFETVDMQFLSDVRITCEACDGKRFRSDVLQVRHRGRNVADLLEMTAQGVADAFADDPPLARPMQALCDLGLGYLRLGQPLSTLSGGEAQRLKIAHHLLQARTKMALFLLDEPSTGLHLHDVHVLLKNLRRLTERGNTVIIVEHHLDIIAAADHVLELGPEGGPEGGRVLYEGDPLGLCAVLDSPTAAHLRRHLRRQQSAAADRSLLPQAPAVAPTGVPIDHDPGHIEVRGARTHNLQNVSLDIARDQFVVITGLSGSGKSSLAFDVVFAEGQRRFLDCLSPFARQYLPPSARPDVDRLAGLPPTVAIAQRTTRGGSRSTVATMTDIYPYLRLLYARCGTQLCPKCGGPVSGQSADEVAAALDERFGAATVYVLAPAVRGRKGHHKEIIDRARQFGHDWLHIDGSLVPALAVPELRRFAAHDIDYVTARIDANLSNVARKQAIVHAVDAALALGDGTVLARTSELAPVTWSLRRHCGRCDLSVEAPDPRLFAFTTAAGWCPACQGTGIEAAEVPAQVHKARDRGARKQEQDGRSSADLARSGLPDGGEKIEDQPLRLARVCSACAGSRLRAEARSVQLGGKTIDAAVELGPAALGAWLGGIAFQHRDAQVAAPIAEELSARCRFLSEVGLDYLALGRGAPTLSGGESQRIRLAAQLSSNLRGVLYVLDEPTIGLHPADNAKLLQALSDLVTRGNGLLVVEHDEETIRHADHVIELGPSGGKGGGRVLAEGSLQTLMDAPNSPTGLALRLGRGRRVRPEPRSIDQETAFITVRGATRNNLKDVTVRFARGRFNAVTGVSGSGKSTLVRDLLVARGNEGVGVTDLRRGNVSQSTELDGIDGVQGLGRIVEVDQAPIGRTPRSCPATYIAVFDDLRKQFAALPEAKVAGLSAANFSFNVEGGRCEACGGAGQIKVEMNFLPTVFVPCEQCGGSRYDERVLAVRYKGASMADVLQMSLEEAAEHFTHVRAVARPLELAVKMGLGYLQLGQGSNTLSGGEAQRLKIVAELCKKRRFETVYVLDEPTTGLHLMDLQKLLSVLHELVDRGDTLVVIEHQLDLVREADWLVDLGPGAGPAGGQLLHEGPVAALVNSKSKTPTAVALRAQGAAQPGRRAPPPDPPQAR